MAWQTPKVDWGSTDGVRDIDMNRIEENIQYLEDEKVNTADVVDNLTSTDATVPLSANQGRLLDEAKVNTADIVDNLTSTDATVPLSANQGRLLDEAKVNTADIVDNLTSTDATVPLSANQGRLLDEAKVNTADIVDNLTSTDSTVPLSANQGRILNEIKVNTADIVDNLESYSTSLPLSANQGLILNRDKADQPFNEHTQTDGTWYVDDSAGGLVAAASISGNAIQNGTPTPEAPITPACLPAGTEIKFIGYNNFYASPLNMQEDKSNTVIKDANDITVSNNQPVSGVNRVSFSKIYIGKFISGHQYTLSAILNRISGDNAVIGYPAMTVYPSPTAASITGGASVGTFNSNSSNQYISFTIPTGKPHLWILCYSQSVVTTTQETGSARFSDIQVEKGTIKTDFEPYTNPTALVTPCDLWENDVLKPQTGQVVHGDAVIESYNGETIPSTYKSSTGNLTPQKQVTNLVINGDFSNGFTNWQYSNVTYSVSNNTAFFTATASGGNIRQVVTFQTGHIYYAKIKAKLATATTQVTLSTYVGVGADTSGSTSGAFSATTDWQTISKRVVVNIAGTGSHNLGIADTRTSGWSEIQVKEVVFIDLTAAFGAGNEPTAAEMDARLASSFANGWFDGTGTLKGSYVVYKLATPTLEQFTPRPITLPQGVVNVVVDSEVLPSEISMTYRWDLATFVQDTMAPITDAVALSITELAARVTALELA